MQLLSTVAVALSAGAAVANPIQARAAPVDQLVGYGAGTTGGGSGAGTTVTSCSALSTAAAKGGVIRISGTLSGCGVTRLVSNTSILGVGASSGFKNGGFLLKGVSNVIIRNLKFDLPPNGLDSLELDGASNVWIDHNELNSAGLVGSKDAYDGLLDIKKGADAVTISWNKFSDHWKGTLVGHSDSAGGTDTGKLKVTYHHNSFTNVNSRLPSLRFGSGHIYSSCFVNSPTSGINSRMGAKVLVEENSFTDVKLAIVTDLDSKVAGFATSKNNILAGSSTTRITQTGAPSISYAYTADPAAEVCAIVSASGGRGKITV